ncbi:MAG TPA: hypothetical protein VNP95_04185 [Thermomicrobiales bacterium]|jgi:hypothetical protein|nr:hypothetical protein [Thermomicrobiales bacterium]
MAVRHLSSLSSTLSPDLSLRMLERRLDDGYRRIDQGIADGLDVSHWEEFWIDLLRQYEVMADQLAATDDEGAEDWDLAA